MDEIVRRSDQKRRQAEKESSGRGGLPTVQLTCTAGAEGGHSRGGKGYKGGQNAQAQHPDGLLLALH